MSIEADYTSAKTLLRSIEENHRYIKSLLKVKVDTIKKVKSEMDYKVRTKTPLNEGQQRIFSIFTGIYTQEGGKLQDSLVRIESIQDELHSKGTQPFLLSLMLLQKYQSIAIKSLHCMIASGEETLSVL